MQTKHQRFRSLLSFLAPSQKTKLILKIAGAEKAMHTNPLQKMKTVENHGSASSDAIFIRWNHQTLAGTAAKIHGSKPVPLYNYIIHLFS